MGGPLNSVTAHPHSALHSTMKLSDFKLWLFGNSAQPYAIKVYAVYSALLVIIEFNSV